MRVAECVEERRKQRNTLSWDVKVDVGSVEGGGAPQVPLLSPNVRLEDEAVGW